MKRKPTTKQAIQQSLLEMLRSECRIAREAPNDELRETATARAHGAICLAYCGQAIDPETYAALWDLASNARWNRAMEVIYQQPLYSGGKGAEERWKAGRVAA